MPHSKNKNVNYIQLNATQELEVIVVEVWTNEGNIKVIQFYNRS